MNIEISIYGLPFMARCRFIKGDPGSYYQPPEPDDVEILGLECLPDGEDATFLLESTLADRIREVVLEEVVSLAADEDAYLADMRHDERRERELLTG